MSKLGYALLSCAVLTMPLAAAPLSQGERDRAMSYLHATRKMFLDSIDGLSDQQWRYKSAPDRWSVAEVSEHIVLAEDALWDLVQNRVLKQPPAPDGNAGRSAKDEQIMRVVPDRSRRAEAPESVRPAGKWPTRQAVAQAFKERRDRTIAYIQTTQDDLRSHVLKNPVLDELDAYQWILYLAAHSERHIRQIEEVKASPGFPKH
jgi:hypothetical protein